MSSGAEQVAAKRASNQWVTAPFEQVFAEPLRNGVYKKKEFHGTGTRIVNMGELFAFDFISDQPSKRLELTDKELRKSSLKDGDLLFARRSYVLAGSGKCSLVVGPPEDMTFESSIIRARLDQELANPRFFYYLFRSPTGRAAIASIATRTAVSGIRGSDLAKLELTFPELHLQARIASVLSAYDNLIENNARRVTLLEELARLIYQEWFVKFRYPGHKDAPLVESELGPIPRGWEIKTLANVARIVMGQSPKSEFYNETGEGLPFHQGVTDFGHRFPRHRRYCTLQKRIGERGDILFSVRAPVGRINIADCRLVVGRGLSAIKSLDGTQSFLFHQLKHRFVEEDSMGGGTIFKAVTKSDMYGIKMLVPGSTHTRRFERLVIPIDKEIEILTRKNDNLRKTRDLLLPRLVSGGVDMSELDIDIGEVGAS